MSEIRHISYDSTYLNKQMALAVYLPDEYKYGSKFPVLYFLHGRSGDESFIEQLGLAQLTDSLIAASKIEPMIIVCPRMDNSRGLNSAKIARQEKIGNNVIDVGRYEDYFIQEIIPYIDGNFNTIASRKGRYVGGCSAGGFAAIHYGNEHSFHKNNPLEFERFEKLHQKQEWFLDAGDEDEGGFNNAVESLSKKLISHGICVEHHISPGHHNLQYVKSNIWKYLIFYGNRI